MEGLISASFGSGLTVDAAAFSALAALVAACPDCPTSEIVQRSVLDDRFWPHLLVTAAPLLVLGVIVAASHRAGTRRGPGAGRTAMERDEGGGRQ